MVKRSIKKTRSRKRKFASKTKSYRRKSYRKGYVKYGGFSFFKKSTIPNNSTLVEHPSLNSNITSTRGLKWNLPPVRTATQYENTESILRPPVHITSNTRPMIRITNYDESKETATKHIIPSNQDPEKLGIFWYSTNPQFMTKRDYFMKHRSKLRSNGFLYPHIFDTHPKFAKMSLQDLQRYMKLMYDIY